MPSVDDALVRIGRIIGKPPGWESVVRALAPPLRGARRALETLGLAIVFEYDPAYVTRSSGAVPCHRTATA